jgi:hypothetical protein
VIAPFEKLIAGTSQLFLAAPYFTMAAPLLQAVKKGKTIQLLVGLNTATSPEALRQVHEVPGLAVRYLTSRFHAKIYIFGETALLGSSNLTDGGLYSNREAVICLDRPEDTDAIEEIRALFVELWDAGQVLTKEKLESFAKAHAAARKRAGDPDKDIEDAIGRAEPPNINVKSHEKSKERVFLEGLRQLVYEQYRPAFNEVTAILAEHNYRRPELSSVGIANETNRFLNYVSLSHVFGDEAWQTAPLRSPADRRSLISNLGEEWATADDSKVPEDYATWLVTVRQTFGTKDAINGATKEQITAALMSLHAFLEQLRFVKGGAKNLPTEFWKRNDDDLARVKSGLAHLLHGPDDFIKRLHDILYDPSRKLALFGRFCALELFGTVFPDICPPMNGRMAKALRYLGFDVKGA